MDNNTTKLDITTRIELVTRRLAALNKELLTLEKEIQLLVPLQELYVKRPYDSIKEERSHTDRYAPIAVPRHSKRTQVREYLKNYPGCTKEAISRNLNYTLASVTGLLYRMSDVIMNKELIPHTYTLEGDLNNDSDRED